MGKGGGGKERTQYNDDDYRHCVLSFVVVVAHRLLPLVYVIWLPRRRHNVAPASGMKKKLGEAVTKLT